MGEITNFKVNDDGSVTIAGKTPSLNPQEQNILDIFRIEKAKGGAYASRRMKKRALKYGKEAGIPKYEVEKLMLDQYPADFANYPRTSRLITWLCLIVIFLCGTAAFSIAAYFQVEIIYDYDREIKELYDVNRNSDPQEYKTLEYLEREAKKRGELLDHYQNMKEGHETECIWYSAGAFICLLISIIGIIRYRKLSKSIIKNGKQNI